MPINRLGAVKAQGDRILITPFDPANVPAIVRAVTESGSTAIALNPTTVCVSIPALSGEQREETVAMSRSWAKKPRSRSGPSGNRHASTSRLRAGDRSAPSRKRRMRLLRRSSNS